MSVIQHLVTPILQSHPCILKPPVLYIILCLYCIVCVYINMYLSEKKLCTSLEFFIQDSNGCILMLSAECVILPKTPTWPLCWRILPLITWFNNSYTWLKWCPSFSRMSSIFVKDRAMLLVALIVNYIKLILWWVLSSEVVFNISGQLKKIN